MLPALLTLAAIAVPLWAGLHLLADRRLEDMRGRLMASMADAGWEDRDDLLFRLSRSTDPSQEELGDVFKANNPGVEMSDLWTTIGHAFTPRFAWIRRTLSWLLIPHAAALVAGGLIILLEPSVGTWIILVPGAFLALELGLFLALALPA